jgi:hypothetical protein
MSQAHPTDEQLSASLDGHDDGAAAHALDCEACQARLAELRSVIALVAQVPPVDEVARERALALALDTPMAPDIGLARPGQSRVRGGRAGVWLAAAAAVVLVLLAVPLLTRDGDHDQVASRDSAEEVSKTADGSGGATGASGGGLLNGGDLGEFSDPSKLRDVVAPALESFGAGQAAGGTSDAASPSTTTTRGPQSPAALSSGSAAVPCADVVARDYGGGLGPLVYTASVRWNHTPAVVLAYQVAGASGGLDHRVYVLSTDRCALLNVFSL